jgi:NADH:ubiquinone oxidoreductase subunit 3 (subunit A)
LIPWALSYFCLPVVSYYFILFFIVTLVIGFAYEWRNGALNWVIKQ